MSIITCAYVPEGIAMAADSRLTGYRSYDGGLTDRYVLSDNAQKLFLLSKNKIGISWCGNAFIQEKTIADFIRIFEIDTVNENDNVTQTAQKLSDYLKSFPDGNNTFFFVCGYSEDIPYVYSVNTQCVSIFNIKDTQVNYGCCWSGEKEAIDRLIIGDKETEINYSLMPLKDAVDLSEFLVELVIKYQRFEDRVATCGGQIDSLVITKDYAKFVKHKILNP